MINPITDAELDLLLIFEKARNVLLPKFANHGMAPAITADEELRALQELKDRRAYEKQKCVWTKFKDGTYGTSCSSALGYHRQGIWCCECGKLIEYAIIKKPRFVLHCTDSLLWWVEFFANDGSIYRTSLCLTPEYALAIAVDRYNQLKVFLLQS